MSKKIFRLVYEQNYRGKVGIYKGTPLWMEWLYKIFEKERKFYKIYNKYDILIVQI